MIENIESHLLLRNVAPNDLTEAIADRVSDRLREIVAEAAEPRLVDRDRMAHLLSISKPTLDRLTKGEEIPSVLIGSRRLYAPNAVIAALTG